MTEPSVLVVDDDRLFCESLVDCFAARGVPATYVNSYDDARSISLEQYPVVVLDQHLPDGEGLSLVDAANDATRFIVVTAAPSIDHVVAAMRRRVLDYFAKPIELEALVHAVTRALPRPGGVAERRRLDSEPRDDLLRFARSDVPILITGETGTGKSRLARRLHEASPRASGPFIPIDCACLAESVVEAELFGASRGAFTGATERPGLIALAHGGTLFLDEIGELPPRIQAKLLSVLEERRVRALGSSRWREVDARLITATHVDLHDAVARDRFRADLLFRLDVGYVELLPLRDDPSRLEAAIAELLSELEAPTSVRLAPGELSHLAEHSWPGNYRELRNVLARALVLHPIDALRPSSCLRRTRPTTTPPPVELSLAELERRHVLGTLERFRGHRSKTARALGISEVTLRRKLRAWNSAPASAER